MQGAIAESNAGAVAEAKQKKVTRLRVREPDSNNRRGSDTLIIKMLMQSKFRITA
jgi:hypothetical protein